MSSANDGNNPLFSNKQLVQKKTKPKKAKKKKDIPQKKVKYLPICEWMRKEYLRLHNITEQPLVSASATFSHSATCTEVNQSHNIKDDYKNNETNVITKPPKTIGSKLCLKKHKQTMEAKQHDELEQKQDAGASIVVMENNNQTNNVLSAQQQPQQPIYYPLATVQSYQQPKPIQLNGVEQNVEIIQNLTPTNNNIAVSNNVNNNAPIPVPSQTLSMQQQTIPVEQMASVETPTNAPNNDLENVSANALQNDIKIQQTDVIIDQASPEVELNDENTANENEPINVTDENVLASKPTQNEPKTYAQFFKSENFSSSINFVSTNTNSKETPTNNTYASRATQPDLQLDASPNALSSSRSAASRPGQIRERQSSNANQFSDNHQLCLGNIPHHATEEKLKIMFERFGTIVDLCIHSKSGPKIPGVRAPQNYGFNTFNDPESVQNCLSNMPLYYPENSRNAQKLNVEEKKTRIRNENIDNIDRNNRDKKKKSVANCV